MKTSYEGKWKTMDHIKQNQQWKVNKPKASNRASDKYFAVLADSVTVAHLHCDMRIVNIQINILFSDRRCIQVLHLCKKYLYNYG